ncbi:MAG: molecular chaperone TorD family protein [Gammaproteobacteria bacterium]|nr:molecular chaperone TorD family protein [Gammaproteobacteria bacterium]
MSSDARTAESDGDRDLESTRANTYRLLGSLLASPPDAEMLDRLSQIDVDGEPQDASLSPAWRALVLAAQHTTASGASDEHHDLFIGMARGELVPYGSWYLTGFIMEKPLAQLRQDLKELGFARQEDVREPEDHAAALCETMSLVIADADINVARQRQFFEDHIAPWMFRFFEDLQNATSAKFYSAVGGLGEKFLEIDRQYLAMLPH